MVLTSKVRQLPRGVSHAPSSCTPIGPIGTQLRLVDAKWAVAVEVALGSVLESFVVDNHADGTVVRQVAREAGMTHLPSIIICNYDQGPLHSPLPKPSSHLITVSQVLLTVTCP
ncbi:TPA: hypothetical protein ACH3X3_010838 [Trebouxia sp. C0006]